MDPFVQGEGDGPGADDQTIDLDDPADFTVSSEFGDAQASPLQLPDDPLPGEVEPSTEADDHLWMYDTSGRVWDMGPAEIDTDADGVDDSLTRTGPDGLTVYTDRDNDGRVDAVTHIGADGSFAAHSLDPETGKWLPTDVGRLE